MSQDTFFTAKRCQRCDGSLDGGRTMSMFNTQVICRNARRRNSGDRTTRKRSRLSARPPSKATATSGASG